MQALKTPESISQFYDYLSLIFLDIDFVRPGCSSDSATVSFIDSVKGNTWLLLWTFLPLCAMLVLVVVFRAMESASQYRANAMACRQFWLHRFHFSAHMWVLLAGYTITSKVPHRLLPYCISLCTPSTVNKHTSVGR